LHGAFQITTDGVFRHGFGFRERLAKSADFSDGRHNDIEAPFRQRFKKNGVVMQFHDASVSIDYCEMLLG
jgi:hypothetical protein